MKKRSPRFFAVRSLAWCGVTLVVVLAAVLAQRHGSRKTADAARPRIDPPPLNLAGIGEPDPAVVRAIEAARAEVIRAPRSSAAWGRLGMMLLAHGAPPADAIHCFEEAERLDPREPRWPYFQGDSLLRSDVDAALAHLSRAAEMCREQPGIARLKLAEALMARGRFEEAEAHFRRLLDAHPGHARAALGLGRIAFLQGDPAAARDRLAPALSDSMTRKTARTLLAEIALRQGDRPEAERLAAETAGWPDDPPWPDPFGAEVARMETGRKRILSVSTALMRAGRHTEAIRLLRDARSDDPESDRVLLLLGMAHHMAKNWTEAEKVLRAAAEKTPGAPRVLFHLGNALAAQDRFAEAAEFFAKAAKRMPDDADVRLREGMCQARLGHSAEAETAFRAALDCKPDFVEAHRRLGGLLMETGRRDEAAEHLRAAADLNPRDETARRFLDDADEESVPAP